MRIWRLMRSRPVWVLASVMAWSSVADAQLFPNLANHKRQRTDCALEKPVFGMYRQQYYGYYPTCWRKFPAGWGCPNPEAPNWEAELARRPLEMPDEGLGADEGQDGLFNNDDPFEGGAVPPLPQGRSPFELDAPTPGDQPNGDNQPPVPTRPRDLLDGAPSPFDMPEPGASRGTPAPVAEEGLALPAISPAAGPESASAPAPGSDLPPLEFGAISDSRPVVPVSQPSDGSLPPSRQPESRPTLDAATIPGSGLISPAMAPPTMPGQPLPGFGGPPEVIDPRSGSFNTIGAPVMIGDPGTMIGEPMMPGNPPMLTEPVARPGGKIRGFVNGLLYGRGLRR